jgi:hypothetical protein
MKRLTMILIIAALLAVNAPPAAAQTAGEAAGAALLPADVELFAWLNTADLRDNVDLVLGLDRRFQPIGGISADLLLESAVSDLISDMELSYARDVTPWLGDEIVLGLKNVSPALLRRAPGTLDFALVIESENRSASLALVQRVMNHQKQIGAPLNESIYGGVALYETEQVALALPGDSLVLGTSDMVRQVIDVYNGAPSLAASDDFARVVGALPAGAAGGLFIGQSAFGQIVEVARTAAPELPAYFVQASSALQGIAFSARVSQDAVMVDVAEAVDMEALAAIPGMPMPAIPEGETGARLAGVLPEDTVALLAGLDLSAAWANYNASLYSLEQVAPMYDELLMRYRNYHGPSFTDVLRFVQHLPNWFERLFLLDIEDDLLAWMGGEYGVALVPMNRETPIEYTSRFPLDLVAVVEATDEEAAAAALDTFNESLSALGFSFDTDKIDDVEVHTARLMQRERLAVSWALVDGFGVVGTDQSVEKLLDVAAGRVGTLAGNPRLTDALSRLDGPGQTLLFFDVAGFVPYVLETLPEGAANQFRRNAAPVLSAFDSLALSSRATEDGLHTATFLAVFSAEE